jgi:7,8-dihydroneopterin aldolase/epimerase/oxygenase
MLTISLHGIAIHANRGLYPEEQITGNNFEVDVDIVLASEYNAEDAPFTDYTLVYDKVAKAFQAQEQLLEGLTLLIYHSLKKSIPYADKIKVAVRKLHPPIQGKVRYAEVRYEQ